ncbi:MAG: hypothetical protein HY260_12590 [Chloroflexi bacterium]|nr:hypothetical protein [Chloroflexota bacterium]
MPDYDPSFRPPAPVVPVEVRNPVTGASIRVRAQIDTGTSTSVLSLAAVADLDLASSGTMQAANFDGTLYRLSTYLVTLLLEGYVVLGAEIAAGTRNDLLLGRDILQHFVLTLNGKAETFELVDP